MTLERRTPLTADPSKTKAWQARGAKAYADRRRDEIREGAPKQVRRPKKRRNDAPWRNEVMALRGERCRACGSTRRVQCDHVKPRSQGGPSVIENGLPLCESCHTAKTDSRMLLRREWLDPDQIEWLAAVGWVAWDEQGQPYGHGWKHFAATVAA